MSRHALVTGAGGFVGANLCRRLLDDGVTVDAAVRPGADRWRLDDVASELAFHEVQITDRTVVARLFETVRPDWVFHLAAHGAYSWQTDVGDILAVNAGASAQLIDLAVEHDIEAFVQAGSSSEYGYKDHPPGEHEWIDPNSAYAVGKAAATQYARAVSLHEDRHMVTLRLYSVYGRWEEPNRLLPALAIHGMRGGLPPLVDPRTARDYVAVDDVCDALTACARRTQLARGSVFNVASGTQTSLGDLVEMVRHELGISEPPAWSTMPARGWDTHIWVGDPTRIRSEVGWEATTSMDDGFTALVHWLERNPKLRERYEQSLTSLTG